MPDIDEKVIEEKLAKDPTGSSLTKEETQHVMSQPNITDGNTQPDPDADNIPDSEFEDTESENTEEEENKEETSASEKKDEETSSSKTGKEEKSEDKKPEEKAGDTGKPDSQKKEDKKPEEKEPEDEGTFFVKLETELAKEEGTEDLTNFTPREKGLFYQLRNQRRRAQRAEADADSLRFANIKRQKKQEEEAANKEEEDKRDPEDFITVKDSKELSKNLSESAKRNTRQTFIAIAQMNARDRIDARRERGEDLPDYDEVMELGETIIETNDEYKAKIYEAYLKGKNLALVTYDLIRKDPRFTSLFKPGKASQKPPEKKEEKKTEEKKEEKKPEDKTKEGKETQEKIDKNQKKAKTSAVYGGGGEGEQGKEYTFQELMAMSPTQFKNVPKRIRDQFLKDVG